METKTKARVAREAKIKGEDAEDLNEAKKEDKWRAENDARILTQAEEIKADNPRYAAARAVASEQASALMKVLK